MNKLFSYEYKPKYYSDSSFAAPLDAYIWKINSLMIIHIYLINSKPNSIIYVPFPYNYKNKNSVCVYFTDNDESLVNKSNFEVGWYDGKGVKIKNAIVGGTILAIGNID